MSERPTAAVIGAGVSGLTAAWVLRRTHDVTLYERDPRLGGHAHTHDVATDRGELRIDSGFIVHNERTYPRLLRLFDELQVATQPTEMSMSITCEECGLSYAGGRGAGGILAQPTRVTDRRFVRMLTEVPRFHRAARELLAQSDAADVTWAEFLAQQQFSPYFVRHFAIPLVSCVWSSGELEAGDYPALHLFQFLEHHGMLTIKGSPTWRTVVGGSGTYVDKLAEQLQSVERGRPVTGVIRHDDSVEVSTADGATARFDRAVIATHADDALAVLADATPEEKTALGAIGYTTNHTVLHTDSSALPTRPRARASWNHRLTSCTVPADNVQVSYWMNRLHALDRSATGDTDYVVSLNAAGRIPDDRIIAEMTYQHPIFTRDAVAAGAALRGAGGPRLAFAGAHLGWGFHEDGARSGVDAAARLGVTW